MTKLHKTRYLKCTWEFVDEELDERVIKKFSCPYESSQPAAFRQGVEFVNTLLEEFPVAHAERSPFAVVAYHTIVRLLNDLDYLEAGRTEYETMWQDILAAVSLVLPSGPVSKPITYLFQIPETK